MYPIYSIYSFPSFLYPQRRFSTTFLPHVDLKGVCHKNCNLYFYYSNPSESLINKCFQIHMVWFRRVIRSLSCLHGVQHTAEQMFLVNQHFILQIISFMCSPTKGLVLIVPLKATTDKRRFLFSLHGLMHTAEIDSVVWCTPRRLTLWCDAQCGDWLCGVMHNVEIDSVVWCTMRRLTLRCDAHCVGWLRGVMGAFM